MSDVTIRVDAQGTSSTQAELDSVTKSLDDMRKVTEDLNEQTNKLAGDLDSADIGKEAAQNAATLSRGYEDLSATTSLLAGRQSVIHTAMEQASRGLKALASDSFEARDAAADLAIAQARLNNMWGTSRTVLRNLSTVTARYLRVLAPFAPALLGIAGAYAAVKVAAKATELAIEGGRYERVVVAFDNVARSVKSTAEEALPLLRVATGDAVNDIDLMKNSILALNTQTAKSVEELAEMATIAQILGQAVGKDTSESLRIMVRGIALISPELLKSLGVLVSAESAYRSYAQEIGKSASALTDQERKTAFAVASMNALRESAARLSGQEGELRAQTEGVTAASERYAAAAKNTATDLKITVAESENLQRALVGLLDLKTEIVSFFGAIATSAVKAADAVTGLSLSVFEVAPGTALGGQQLLDDIERIVELMDRAAMLEEMIGPGLDFGTGGLFGIDLEQPQTFAGLETLSLTAEGLRDVSNEASNLESQIRDLELQMAALQDTMRRTTDEDEFNKLEQELQAIEGQLHSTQAAARDWGMELDRQLLAATSRAQELGAALNLAALQPDTLNLFRQDEFRRAAGQGLPAPRGAAAPFQSLGLGDQIRSVLDQFRVSGGVDFTAEQQAVFDQFIESQRRMQLNQQVLNDLISQGTDFTEVYAKTNTEMQAMVITGIGQLAAAWIRGTDAMLSSGIQFVTAMTQQFLQAQAMLAATTGAGFLGLGAGPLSLIGAGIGALGGILGAIFSPDSNDIQKVRIEEISPEAADGLNQGPDRVTVQVMSGVTGEMLDEIEYQLRRRDARDATVVLPTGASLT